MRLVRELSTVACLAILAVGCAHPSRQASVAGVFTTGCEQSVIALFVEKQEPSATSQPTNPLDHALAALCAQAWPTPGRSSLVASAVLALCDEYQHQTQVTISDAQREIWIENAMGKGFESVLKDIERISSTSVDRHRLVQAGLQGMAHGTGWSSACLLTDAQLAALKQLEATRQASGGERGVLGLKLNNWPAVEAVPGTPAADAGIRAGDLLIKIADNDIGHIRSAEEALKLLAGPPGQEARLTFLRNDQQFTVQLRRISEAAAKVQADPAAPGVVRIVIPTFEGSGIADRVKRIVQEHIRSGAHAVVLDLRHNPGGRPEEANAVADIFLDERCLQIMQFRSGKRILFKSHPGAVDVQVVLMTDRMTGSAAEMLAMALRDNDRARIVGQATAGALFGKNIVDVGQDQAILFRCEPTILSPACKDYSSNGIPPDVVIGDSPNDNTDAVLQAALRLVRLGP